MTVLNSYFSLLVLFVNVVYVLSCYNDCSRHGTCDLHDGCNCFKGWGGYDCSQRLCPTGPRVADIANSTDSAHGFATCSGRGICDTLTGNCICNAGYDGANCGKNSCFNGCSGHGQCYSLSAAASAYDGYLFNRTTTYTQWDSHLFHGCKCDPGFSGPDCSERLCETGPDPRGIVYPHEVVTLVCTCSPTCSGRFKLQFMGAPVNPWLYPTSRAYEVANALMNAPSILGNSTSYIAAYSSSPVIASNSSNVNSMLCRNFTTTVTKITFRQNVQDLPTISFYANLISGGSLYFKTTQVLKCRCESYGCNGTFWVSFDGEMSSRITTWGNETQLQKALQAMKTIKAAGVTVGAMSNIPICIPGTTTNHTIVFQAPAGNIPRIQLYSSVINSRSPSTYYNSLNNTQVLQLTTNDGRSDFVKMCNGVGTCDFNTGKCHCRYGFGPDVGLGPCGKVLTNSSRWAGLGRCPGVVDPYMHPDGTFTDLSATTSYLKRLYLSFNPLFKNISYSFISFFSISDARFTPWVTSHYGTHFMNLTSNVSAGPIVLDQSKNRIFFVDANPARNFIGVAPISGSGQQNSNFTIFTVTNYKISGFAMDAHWQRRKLFWTTPGVNGVADGKIYWAYMDSKYPQVNELSSAIGQSNLVDPKGIGIHFDKIKIFWVDKVITGSVGYKVSKTALKSCNFDGSGAATVQIYSSVGPHTMAANYSDMVIDFSHNDTVLFFDTGYPQALVASTLNRASFPAANHSANNSALFTNMQSVRVIRSSSFEPMQSPRFMTVDSDNAVIYWTDPQLKVVKFARYGIAQPFLNSIPDPTMVAEPMLSPLSGTTYQYGLYPNEITHDSYLHPYYPVGIALDPGLGKPTFDTYLDCFGNGICTGFAGNWTCQCYPGFIGDCSQRSCPTGPAWFHEPGVDEIAHDVVMECSNMGLCDRKTGACQCRIGYEGSACERMSCGGQTATANHCNGRGRCMSMRNMALHHKDEAIQTSPLQYGSSPHNPATWDADSIYGCVADEYGYYKGSTNFSSASVSSEDLRELMCPFGYNTRLADKIYYHHSVGNASGIWREVQQIECAATSGNFFLSFRGKVSGAIPYNSNSYQVQQVLQSVPSIGAVQVTAVGGTTVCRAYRNGATMNVTFVSELGTMPAMVPIVNTLQGTVTVSVYQSSSRTALMECSGHGTCNRLTGECECFPQWASSDGVGNAGPRGDCGHTLVL